MSYAEDMTDDEAAGIDLLAAMDAVNVAEQLSSDELRQIGQKVRRGYDRDKQSRNAEGWDEKQKTAMDLARQVKETKTWPWPNAANVKYPLLTVAAIQFAARSYPALVQGRNVVKAKVIGDDPDGQKRDKADRISRHMSWQCLEQMDEWEDEFDRLLHVIPITGCAFKKVRWDNRLARPKSEVVTAECLVVDYWAKSLGECSRATHEFKMFPYRIAEKMRAGLWLDVELGRPQDAGDDDQAEHLFLEQHCWLDLDGDGYEEPWIVTLHHETSQVVSIIARFDEDGLLMDEQGNIGRIEPVQYFVKYGFIPNPDGSFYDIGFGHLLEPLNEAINTTINQLLDAGTLSTTGGGWIGRGAKVKSGTHRFTPGEWKPVEATGGDLASQIVPLPVREPSSVLFSLLGLLIDAGRDITAIKDVLLGEADTQQTATTTLALIEQGMKVFGSLYKRLHRSAGKEFKLIFRLNRLYMPEEQYFTVLDDPEAAAKADYDDKSFDVVPVSDPSMVSDMQRMARAQFLMEITPVLGLDADETARRVLEAAQIDDPDKLIPEQRPPSLEAEELELKKRQDVRAEEADLANLSLTNAQVRKLVLETAMMPREQQMSEDELDLKVAELMTKTALEREKIRMQGKAKANAGS